MPSCETGVMAVRRSISRIFTDAAADDPSRVVLVDADGEVTAAALDAAASRLSATLRASGVGRDDLVAISLPNDRSFVVAAVAVWRAGATPLPIAPHRSDEERAALVRAAGTTAFVGDAAVDASVATVPSARVVAAWVGAPVPLAEDVWAAHWKAVPSSGSTGEPKIVLAAGPALFDPTRPVAVFLPREAVQLVSGPLWHSAVFTYAMRGLMTGHRLIVLPRFEERAWLEAVARHGVTWALLVPTMMHRLLREPAHATADVSSLETIVHMGAPSPVVLKTRFLEWLGPQRVIEVYAGSESNGLTMIGGEEWLRHPGSVGRPIGGTEVQIRRVDGTRAGVGEVGEVWMRRGADPAYRYLNAPSRRDAEGWDTLRDLGTLDADGRLFLRDRVDDVIVRGGVRIPPAEVEAVLESHPSVRSALAFGFPDGRGGELVAAVVDVADSSVGAGELDRWAEEEFDPAHRPVRIHLVREPLRNDAGKASRGAWARRLRDA